MLTYNASLKEKLDAAPTKMAWANIIKTELGNDRMLRCFRDNNSAASDPTLTGIEFMKMGTVGDLVIQAGNITGFGLITSSLISLAADLTTGKSVLRIEGNGNWVQGSLSLGNTTDFSFSANPTGNASSGVGFNSVGLKAPEMLSTGVGPLAPVLDKSAPATFTLESWEDPANPTIVGTIAFNRRDLNLVATDPEIADSMGDVRVTKSNDSIIFGNFEFGGLILSMNKSCNAEDETKTLHQFVSSVRPHGTVWAEKYPSFTGYDETSDLTHPLPFKGYLHDGNGKLLETFEMRDGLPINSPELPQTRNTTEALRPWMTCAAMLNWESHEPKENSKARKFFNGMQPDVLRPSTCKEPGSTNAWVPMTGKGQHNGALHLWAAPRWPMPIGSFNSVDYPDSVDPYLYNADTASGNSALQGNRVSGWDYEIGSISCHDRYTGPGGIRAERCIAPPSLTAYLTAPDGVRPKGNVPYKTMMHAWNRAYFNQSRHFFKNVKTFEAIPQKEVFRNEWSHCKSYYGSNEWGYAPERDNHIPLFASVLVDSYPKDHLGRRPWNGDAVDYMHAYSQPGWAVLINNSPMYLISHQHYVYSTMLSWLGGGVTANPDYTNRFMKRQDAWHWFAMTMAWKLASDHPTLGISRSVVEDRMMRNLDSLYKTVYLPSLTSQSLYFKAIRNFGVPAEPFHDTSNTGKWYLRDTVSSMAFYMAHVFALMKQTGVWDRLWNASVQNQTTMKFWVECYDKYSIDLVLDTDLRYDYYINLTRMEGVTESDVVNQYVPTSWPDWATTVRPKTGVEDWVTNPDGSMRRERDGNTHLRAQYAFMRRDFDLYVPNEKIEAAADKYQGYYDLMETRINALSTPYNKALSDWQWRWPGNGIIKPALIEE